VSGNFEGKVALVTGAASGIGRAAARQFAGAGAAVAVADIDRDGAMDTARGIEAEGGRALAVRVDVAERAGVEAMVETTVSKLGGLDYAFNNAGVVGGGAPISDMAVETFDRGIGVMLRGVFLCMKFEIPVMAAAGGGAIVNTSSGAGLIGFPGMADYVAAKHAPRWSSSGSVATRQPRPRWPTCTRSVASPPQRRSPPPPFGSARRRLPLWSATLWWWTAAIRSTDQIDPSGFGWGSPPPVGSLR
jgi:NADP-dependent 3-hydroxy acid dehydrogenase YdfG